MRNNQRRLRRWKTAVAIVAALVLYALPSSALLAASHYGAILAR
jgi:hypothetical protein